ncbi:MAG: hypothetical protein K0R78_1894 [Pelosinus sp.]|nr:hypothetical protein [Pelosinus sp.]
MENKLEKRAYGNTDNRMYFMDNLRDGGMLSISRVIQFLIFSL